MKAPKKKNNNQSSSNNNSKSPTPGFQKTSNQYPIFDQWYKTNDWILQRCETMPKHTRFTISSKIACIALENTDLILKAIYSKQKVPLLNALNLNLERLRIFFRMCKDRRYISINQFGYITGELNTTGKMCGGWIKQCKE